MTAKKMLLGVLALVGLTLAVCGYAVMGRRVEPEPPPRGATTTAPAFLERESSLEVAVAIDVAWIARITGDKLPGKLLSRSAMTVGPGVTADIEVRRDGQVTAEAREGAIHLRVPVAADIKARWQPQAWRATPPWGARRELRLQPTFVIDAQLRLDVDPAWNLETATEAMLRWENDPIVPIGAMRVPLSSLVGDQVREQFAAAVRTIDDRIGAEVPLQRVIGEAWTSGFRAVALDRRGERWLALRPTGLYLGDVHTRDDKVFVAAGLRGVFRVVVGEAPRVVVPTPLPVRSAPPAAPGLTLEVPVRVTFAAANRELDAHVEAQTFEVAFRKGASPALFTIEDIEVYPSGTRVAVALAFSVDVPRQPFDVSGVMYLLGTPSLDVGRSEMRLIDLSYDAQTNLALLDFAGWMLHAEISRRLEERLVFPFGERLESYRDDINAVIGDHAISESLRLRGAIDRVQVTALTITDTDIVALAQLRGQAQLEMR